MIPRRPLHQDSDIKVTAIGMGAASLGNVYGTLTEEKKTENIHTAFKAGINYFDTSPFYGGTTSEHYLGRAIRDLPRSEIVLATKVGRFTNPPDAAGKVCICNFLHYSLYFYIHQLMILSNHTLLRIAVVSCRIFYNVYYLCQSASFNVFLSFRPFNFISIERWWRWLVRFFTFSYRKICERIHDSPWNEFY